MKTKNMKLSDLFANKIHALYDIENNLVKALPKMADAAMDEDLTNGFLSHLEETKIHVERLEKVYSLLGIEPEKLKVEAIRGLVDDGQWVIDNIEPETARDANLARAAQFVEHYEMAGYITAISWAEELGKDDIAEILNQTLEEEMGADMKLSEIGEKLDSRIM